MAQVDALLTRIDAQVTAAVGSTLSAEDLAALLPRIAVQVRACVGGGASSGAASGTFTLAGTASGRAPTSGLPAPTDLGDTLDAYLSQPGGQTIVIPAGKHLTGSVSDRPHDDWLILLAEEPGTVTADGTSILNTSRVLLGGVNFGGSVWPASGTNRLVLWYCDVVGTSGRAGINAVSVTGGGPPGDYVWVMGTNVHDCDHDGMKVETSNARFTGGRMWDIRDPTGVNHDDCFQSRRGVGSVVADFVFGLDPSGTADGNGHTQLQTDLSAAVEATFERGWITQSGSYPITADTKGNAYGLTVTATDLYAWANGTNTTLVNTNGPVSVSKTRVELTAPPAGTTAPDLVWQAANPYESAPAWLAATGL